MYHKEFTFGNSSYINVFNILNEKRFKAKHTFMSD